MGRTHWKGCFSLVLVLLFLFVAGLIVWSHGVIDGLCAMFGTRLNEAEVDASGTDVAPKGASFEEKMK